MSTPAETPVSPGHKRAPFPGTEELNPAEIFAGPGYQAPPVRTDPVAIAALGLGLLSLVPAVGLLAAAMGWWALTRARNRYSTGVSMAWFGIVMGLTSSVCWAWLWWLVDIGGN